jgi:hypothetical protein
MNVSEGHDIKKVLKAGVVYFALVFGAGFVLGPIRIMWLVPRVGTRLAELIEMPLMLGVVVFAARWVVRKFAVLQRPADRLGMGCIALFLLLTAEFGFVLRLRGLSMREYFTTMDPVSGTVFFVMQGIFAIMPLIVGQTMRRNKS